MYIIGYTRMDGRVVKVKAGCAKEAITVLRSDARLFKEPPVSFERSIN